MDSIIKFCVGAVVLIAIAVAVVLQFAHKLEN